jgi:hypothetical protein
MNIIDRNLEELRMTNMRTLIKHGKFNVSVQRRGAPAVHGHGESLEIAVRDALENSRIGNTILQTPQPGERMYTVEITQNIKTSNCDEVLFELRRILALNDDAAKQLAQLAYGDRPGFVRADVTFFGLI